MSKRPRLENMLHIFDENCPPTYTLFYEPLPGADTTAPTSQVNPLPQASFTEIPVSWSGQDDTSISAFDIFVSENGQGFEPWLQGTALFGATFQANPGSQYAFYSVARDPAGNMEVAPQVADTQTVATLNNATPCN